MTTLTAALSTVEAVKRHLAQEAVTTARDIDNMIAGLRIMQETFNLSINQTIADMEALAEGRTKSIEEAIGEQAEPLPFQMAAE